MVAGLAFLATAIATVFAQATGVRFTRRRKPHERAWTIALALFALASAALATGASTGWDRGTFRVFYLLGAVLCVPWLALGTVYLLAGAKAGRRTETALILFSGFAVGVLLSAPIHGAIAPAGGIPVGKDHFGVMPRVLAGVASSIGATVILVGAVWSAVRFARSRAEGSSRLAAGNGLIALGTLVLSSGGLVQGVVGKDEAFALTLAGGIAVIYAGFAVASSIARPASSRNARRGTLPAKL
jgi:MFS family permease